MLRYRSSIVSRYDFFKMRIEIFLFCKSIIDYHKISLQSIIFIEWESTFSSICNFTNILVISYNNNEVIDQVRIMYQLLICFRSFFYKNPWVKKHFNSLYFLFSAMSSIPEIEVTDEAKNMSITEGPADPWCDEKNPKIVDFEKICAAAYRIHGGIVKTPCDVGFYNLFFCFYCDLISTIFFLYCTTS